MSVTKLNTKTEQISFHHTEPIMEIDTEPDAIEKFMMKLRRQANYPPARFTYHAFMNRRGEWTIEAVKIILDHALANGLEVRAWSNEETGINLIVVKDPDRSENSGFDLYMKMEGKICSYGLSSWYEFDKWGIPIKMYGDMRIEKSGHSIIIETSKDEAVIID